MKFLETFISDVFQNSQPISRKSSLKSPGGRFLNHSTVLSKLAILTDFMEQRFQET